MRSMWCCCSGRAGRLVTACSQACLLHTLIESLKIVMLSGCRGHTYTLSWLPARPCQAPLRLVLQGESARTL